MTANLLDRSVAPEVRPLPHLSLPLPETVHTRTGLPLVVLTSATCDAPVFQLRITVGGLGSFDLGRPELASLYPLMLNQGSGGLDGDKLSEIYEGAGAWVNISQQSHHLDIIVRGLTDTAPEVVTTLAQMLRAPLFPARRLAVIAESRAMQREVALKQPKVLARESTALMLWGEGHIAATSASPDDLRGVVSSDLVAVHSGFAPSRMTLYLSGHVDQALIDTVTDAFDEAFEGDNTSDGQWHPNVMPPAPTAGFRRIDLPDSRQAAVSIAIPAIMRSHPDYELLRLAVTGLGGYFGSRLNTELREERGLTYGVSAALVGSLDGAFMSVATECRRDAADEAVEAIEAEIARFVSEPPHGDELKRLLSYSTTRLAAILDSPFAILDTAEVQQATIGTPVDYFDRTQAAIASATPYELARVAATHLSDLRCTTVAE